MRYSNSDKLRQHIRLADARVSFDYGGPGWPRELARFNCGEAKRIFFSFFHPVVLSCFLRPIRSRAVTSSATRRKLAVPRRAQTPRALYSCCIKVPRGIRGVLRNCGDPSQIQFSKHPAAPKSGSSRPHSRPRLIVYVYYTYIYMRMRVYVHANRIDALVGGCTVAEGCAIIRARERMQSSPWMST